MTTFFAIRVELHGIDHEADTYRNLHARMEARGFTRKIEADDGRMWKLPPAEYRYKSDFPTEVVRDLAFNIARQEISTKLSVYVVKEVDAAWRGLDLV
ncbi:MAG TPA: hypothetical protein VGU69_05930 [Rhizomicrobium sp.]|nr:hypothetical protein [Rhizomicrobium sp.]